MAILSFTLLKLPKSSYFGITFSRFQIVCKELTNWKHDAIMDDEMFVVLQDGVSHFNSLENWNSPADGNLKYYVFDILWLDGKSLLQVPLLDRKEILQRKLPKSDAICFNEHFPGNLGMIFMRKQINSS